jgi:mono/diheme cytochrome c family protein
VYLSDFTREALRQPTCKMCGEGAFMMPAARLVTCLALTLGVVGLALAESNPTIKTVPLVRTSATSGNEMFRAYCAVCHGTDGKGNGPAAAYLKTQPTDLTRLAATNGGKYPDLRVSETLATKEMAQHENLEISPWGHLFKSLNDGRGTARLRVANLTRYIETLQQ